MKWNHKPVTKTRYSISFRARLIDQHRLVNLWKCYKRSLVQGELAVEGTITVQLVSSLTG